MFSTLNKAKETSDEKQLKRHFEYNYFNDPRVDILKAVLCLFSSISSLQLGNWLCGYLLSFIFRTKLLKYISPEEIN